VHYSDDDYICLELIINEATNQNIGLAEKQRKQNRMKELWMNKVKPKKNLHTQHTGIK